MDIQYVPLWTSKDWRSGLLLQSLFQREWKCRKLGINENKRNSKVSYRLELSASPHQMWAHIGMNIEHYNKNIIKTGNNFLDTQYVPLWMSKYWRSRLLFQREWKCKKLGINENKRNSKVSYRIELSASPHQMLTYICMNIEHLYAFKNRFLYECLKIEESFTERMKV